MKKIKAIFWDNDGVLVDTEKLYFEANKQTFLKHGVVLTEELYVEYFLRNAGGAWHLLKERNYTDEMIEKIRTERNELYSRLLEEKSNPIDGANNVLKYFHGKYMMGIVTSSRKDHFEKIHMRTGFKKYFDFVITSDDISNVKPNPEPYLKALEVSRMNKEDCIVVEDSERGLKSAMGAGIRCYIIPTHLTKDSDFTGSEKVLNNIREIISIIK